jgi:hypothetical protein
MVLISLERFDEKNCLQQGRGDLSDLPPILGFGDMEDFPIGVKIVRPYWG